MTKEERDKVKAGGLIVKKIKWGNLYRIFMKVSNTEDYWIYLPDLYATREAAEAAIKEGRY